MAKLSRKRLDQLAQVASRNGMWINTSWSDWPNGEQPKWVSDQFGIARELVRLAQIGIEAERQEMSASQ